jgi:hypothetical protein
MRFCFMPLRWRWRRFPQAQNFTRSPSALAFAIMRTKISLPVARITVFSVAA